MSETFKAGAYHFFNDRYPSVRPGRFANPSTLVPFSFSERAFRSRTAGATFANRTEKHHSHAYARSFIRDYHFFHAFQWLT